MRWKAILGLLLGIILGLTAYQASALVEESFGTLDGAVSSPAFYFHTNPKLGFYRNRDFDYIGFVANNREIFKYDSTGLTLVTGTLTVSTLHATGAVTFDSTLTVTGATTLGVLGAGATSVTTLNASGTSTLAGVNAGATTVTTLNAAATAVTTLGATGAVTFGSTLGVTGATALGVLGAGASTVTTLTTTGATLHNTTLGVTGISTLTGGIVVGAAVPTTITNIRVFSIATTPASVAAAVCVEQAVTVTGVTTADKIVLGGFTATGNATGYGAARVSAADTVQQTVCNPTAGALVPAASTNLYIAIRS